MNILQAHLDAREDKARDNTEADRRWLIERGGIDPAERLLKWDRWLHAQLFHTLRWPLNDAARERLLRQCAAEMTVMVKHLAGRGWLLDGEALAAHVQAVLRPIAKAQQAGKVGDFYPYFRAAVARYVGANAEEIQHQARRTGADEGAQTVGAILAGLRVRGASMTELITQRSQAVAERSKGLNHERPSRRRARPEYDNAQGQLF